MSTPPDALGRQRAVVDICKTFLAGQTAGVQGAALVELLALYIAGHAPPLRDELLALHFDAVRRMVPIVEAELFGAAGHPGVTQ